MLALLGSAMGLSVSNGDLCSIIAADIPSECKCTPAAAGGTLACDLKVSVGSFSDEVTMTLDLEPCAQPSATATFEVKETAAAVDYKKGVSLPDTEEIPIPQLDWQIPGLPVGAQANIAVEMTGDLQALVLELGLDACITLPVVGTSCGADLPIPGFPLYLVKGTFDFSSLCAAVEGA